VRCCGTRWRYRGPSAVLGADPQRLPVVVIEGERPAHRLLRGVSRVLKTTTGRATKRSCRGLDVAPPRRTRPGPRPDPRPRRSTRCRPFASAAARPRSPSSVFVGSACSATCASRWLRIFLVTSTP
jgi:hypothetical protein